MKEPKVWSELVFVEHLTKEQDEEMKSEAINWLVHLRSRNPREEIEELRDELEKKGFTRSESGLTEASINNLAHQIQGQEEWIKEFFGISESEIKKAK